MLTWTTSYTSTDWQASCDERFCFCRIQCVFILCCIFI